MEFQTISIKDVEEMLDKADVWLIDVRTKEEFIQYHIEGARNIPYDELQIYLKNLPIDKKYILYCERGSTSLKAAKELSKAGFFAYSVIGGLQAINGKRLE